MSQTIREGCFGCKFSDWDADGCTCRITQLLVGNPAESCVSRQVKKPTNADRLKEMTNEQMATVLSQVLSKGIVSGKKNTFTQWFIWLNKEEE